MPNVIGPIASATAGTGQMGDVARRIGELRDAISAQQGGAPRAGQIGQGDEARSRIVDVGAGDASSFAETLKRVLHEVSGAQDRASDVMGKFVRGEPIELHQVMAATEEASISLEMLVDLRNKLVDAYRTVVNMQS